MIKTNVTMTLPHIHDFYFLQAISASIKSEIAKKPQLGFSHSVERLQADIERAEEEIIPNMAFRVFVYIYGACLGEARHARENMARDYYLPVLQKLSRKESFDLASQFCPTRDNIQALVNVYGQKWSSGFGGSAWRQIAEALHLYFKLPPAAFLDYIVDLEHNNGTVFSKDDARYAIFFSVSYPDSFKNFLDYKFRYNILESPFDCPLYVTPRVFRLVKRYSMILQKKQVEWIEPSLTSLDNYSVEWGDKNIVLEQKWAPDMDVSGGNRPNLSHVLEMLPLEDISVKGWTQKKVKAHVTKCKKIARPFFAKLSKSSQVTVMQRIAKWQEWAMKIVNLKKPIETYSIVPVKVRMQKKLLWQFPIPHFGYGQETDYGFTIETSDYMISGKALNQHAVENGFDGSEKWADGHLYMQYRQLYLKVNQQNYYIADPQLEVLFD